MEELRRLNFNKLISIGIPDVTTYSYDEYRNNGCKHTPINGYCISCENKGCNSSEDDDSYKLTNITHGTHSSDFFRAINMEQDTSNWHYEPIVRGTYYVQQLPHPAGYKRNDHFKVIYFWDIVRTLHKTGIINTGS